MERNFKTVLFLAACGLTLLMFLPLIIGWVFSLAIVFAMFLLMFYSHKKHPGKKVDDFYRDLWTFMATFPYFRPWAFYTSLVGSPFDWPKYKSVPASEIAYFRRAVALHMRFWIVARYVSIWIVSIIVPLWGSVLWAVSRYPSRTVVHPPSKVSELGISTVIKLESNSKEKGPERWLFVNGIGLDHELAKLNALHLSAIFNKNIELIYKPTNGLLYDICNILGYRTFNAPNCTELALSVALHETLLDNQVNKVVLIAHSRGTLVASATIRKIIEEGTTQLRKAIESKLEVYNFANCADVFATVTNRPYYENFVNKEDFLANLCSSTEPRVERLQPGKETTSPKIFYNKNPGKVGHLLGAHYLPDFVAGLYMGPSEETTTSRLFNYLHKP